MKTPFLSILFWATFSLTTFAQKPANTPTTSNENTGPLHTPAPSLFTARKEPVKDIADPGTPPGLVRPDTGSAPTFDMFDKNLFPPAYPGGEQALHAYLAQNIRYPARAIKDNIQGVVALTFIIEKDGMINQVAIVKDIGGGCGEEAARVVSVMPNWRPGTVDGNPVKVRFTLPVRFRLEGVAPRPANEKKKWWQREALFGENR